MGENHQDVAYRRRRIVPAQRLGIRQLRNVFREAVGPNVSSLGCAKRALMKIPSLEDFKQHALKQAK
jgi:hypothetical protein